jgi:hypothetical protein
MTNIDLDVLVTVTGGTLASTTNPSLLQPPRLPMPQPKPQPQPAWPTIPGADPRFPPGSLDLPRRNDLA